MILVKNKSFLFFFIKYISNNYIIFLITLSHINVILIFIIYYVNL